MLMSDLMLKIDDDDDDDDDDSLPSLLFIQQDQMLVDTRRFWLPLSVHFWSRCAIDE